MLPSVDWSHRSEYIPVRHGVSQEEADEALVDPERLVLDPDPASLSGQSLRVIGWSTTRQELLTVILVRQTTGLFRANAWTSSQVDVRRYVEVRHEFP